IAGVVDIERVLSAAQHEADVADGPVGPSGVGGRDETDSVVVPLGSARSAVGEHHLHRVGGGGDSVGLLVGQDEPYQLAKTWLRRVGCRHVENKDVTSVQPPQILL